MKLETQKIFLDVTNILINKDKVRANKVKLDKLKRYLTKNKDVFDYSEKLLLNASLSWITWVKNGCPDG